MSIALVSIIIPVYNAGDFLEETILCALAQTWPNTEIIIVDDGSTDNSLAIAKKHETGNVKVISQANAGASAARNKGLDEAKGNYIQFLDADDILSPDKIESQMAALKSSEHYIALCSTVHFKNGENHLDAAVTSEWYDSDSNDPVDFLLKVNAGHETMPGYGGMIQPNAWLTPRKLIDKAGRWNEFKCPDDDGEFFCRVILAGSGVKFSKQGINYYRKFDDGRSLSASRSRESVQNMVKAIDLKHEAIKTRTNHPLLDRIFSRHYWTLGVWAYPEFKDISANCIQTAKRLGYVGEKYAGGPSGHIIAKIFGWKAARWLSHYKHRS